MKVAITNSYGPPEVFQITDLPDPKTKHNEILVKVKATAVTAADSRIRGARFPKGFGFFARLVFGITKPRAQILGSTFSGVVTELGEGVTNFKVGDEVCGMTGIKMGTYAEYITISNFKSIAKKPTTITHQDAAGMLFGGTAALYFLREKLGIKKGEHVVINGASGAVGTNAVQLAKYFGAKVTGVTSGDNAKLVRELGAEEIIDYTKQDLVGFDQKFDVVLDTVGNISPKAAKSLLNPNGRAGLMVGSLWEMLRMHGSVKGGTATEKSEDIEFLLSLMERGTLKTVIDKTYSLEQIAEAHRRVDSGRKVGNNVIKLN